MLRNIQRGDGLSDDAGERIRLRSKDRSGCFDPWLRLLLPQTGGLWKRQEQYGSDRACGLRTARAAVQE